MILRVAHFRTPAEAAPTLAGKAQALYGRIRRTDGLAWATVGRQPDGESVVIIAVSLWHDDLSLRQALGADAEGRSEAEAREGLPAATRLELADVVDGGGTVAEPAPVDPLSGRRRRELLPQDRELLRRLCAGATLAEAAAELGVSVGTAKNRRHEIYEKLGVHDLRAACALAAPALEAGRGVRAG